MLIQFLYENLKKKFAAQKGGSRPPDPTPPPPPKNTQCYVTDPSQNTRFLNIENINYQ